MNIEKSVARLTAGLGQLLLRFRTENNLTRTELAAKLDVSEGRIRQLESGDNAQSFKIEFLFSVSKALAISPPDLLNQLMHESKVIDGVKSLPALEDAFSTSIQGTASSEIFTSAIKKTDELFGNHFVWSLRMAELLLKLDEPAKVKVEIALRRASPLKSTDEFKARIMHLLSVDLDYPEN